MKKYFISLFMLLLGVLGTKAQDAVTFEFNDGIGQGNVKTRMERNVSQLLTAINSADSRQKDVNFSGIDIDDLASQSITMLWNSARFRAEDDEIVERCLTIRSSSGAVIGYQVRNIPIEMHPVEDGYVGDLNQEACIDFDKNGRITDFNITMGATQYLRIIREGEELGDMDRRMQILHWVEQFRNAYCQKDIEFMDNVFSEDALIVTGKVTKRVPNEIGGPVGVTYTTQGKQQYLANLRRVFKNNSYINVKFDDITVVRHASKPHYYGVTLKQGWFTKNYSDEGIVFIVWDFRNELEPKIMVRTWQPMEDDGNVFSLKNFKLQ